MNEYVEEREQEIINYNIEDFLSFLYTEKEIDIYYMLLHLAEIREFNSTTLSIMLAEETTESAANPPRIQQLLFAWTRKKLNVIITKQSHITSLKNELINKIKSYSDWQLVKDNFPLAEIKEILFRSKE